MINYQDTCPICNQLVLLQQFARGLWGCPISINNNDEHFHYTINNIYGEDKLVKHITIYPYTITLDEHQMLSVQDDLDWRFFYSEQLCSEERFRDFYKSDTFKNLSLIK